MRNSVYYRSNPLNSLLGLGIGVVTIIILVIGLLGGQALGAYLHHHGDGLQLAQTYEGYLLKGDSKSINAAIGLYCTRDQEWAKRTVSPDTFFSNDYAQAYTADDPQYNTDGPTSVVSNLNKVTLHVSITFNSDDVKHRRTKTEIVIVFLKDLGWDTGWCIAPT